MKDEKRREGITKVVSDSNEELVPNELRELTDKELKGVSGGRPPIHVPPLNLPDNHVEQS